MLRLRKVKVTQSQGKQARLCALQSLSPLIRVFDEVAVILLRRRRISGDTVAFLQMLVFPGTKGP